MGQYGVAPLGNRANYSLRDAPCLGPFEGLCGATDLCIRVLVGFFLEQSYDEQQDYGTYCGGDQGAYDAAAQ